MKKRIVFFVLAAALLVLSACGGSPSGGTDPVALGKDLTEQAESLPDMTVVSSETADGEELFPYLSSMDYSKVAGYYLAYASAGTAEEIAVIRVRNAADANEARASLEKHLQDRQGIFRVYNPEQSAMVDKARISVHGDTVALIICTNADDVDIAFREAVAA